MSRTERPRHRVVGRLSRHKFYRQPLHILEMGDLCISKLPREKTSLRYGPIVRVGGMVRRGGGGGG